ncbi:hypothetical protein CPB84DRAFT_201359 [Gymnopilus junonius]|uniref:Uncharacterized protein n=1 Tax=Gymnopilus junonius TaxID=109634 RepID=A0A9P5NT19_GYMJU|nr:hypothetical protein CPB84DRAFT_201359 [Gymnopilus junonius]
MDSFAFMTSLPARDRKDSYRFFAQNDKSSVVKAWSISGLQGIRSDTPIAYLHFVVLDNPYISIPLVALKESFEQNQDLLTISICALIQHQTRSPSRERKGERFQHYERVVRTMRMAHRRQIPRPKKIPERLLPSVQVQIGLYCRARGCCWQ